MDKKFDLTGKNAVVTGGGSGIGRAISLVLAAQGAKVYVFDMNLALAEETLELIKAQGGDGELHICDVSNTTALVELFESVFADTALDILINNAGIAHIGNVLSTDEEDLDKLYAVNIKGVFNGLKCAVKHMTKGGVIVNLSSIAAHVGLTDRFAYSMTKGAVHAMTLSVAKDYIHQNIRCNSISPGRVHTPFVDNFIKKNYPGEEEVMFDKLSKSQPIGRMAQPTEIGDLVLYLCSDEASFITGSDFSIDGGFVTLNN